MQRARAYLVDSLLYLSLGYFAYLMVLITLQYVPLRFDVAFLRLKDAEISRSYYQVAFFSHVYTSIFVLLAGFTQFSTRLRRNFPVLHRGVGKIYIFLVLVVASPSGLIMGYHANGGLGPQISFCLQAVLWFVFTLLAFRYAISRNWARHANFMMRSYALTLSAISLRLFKWGIVSIFELPPMDTYRIVAWLGWLANIGLVELLIWRRSKGSLE